MTDIKQATSLTGTILSTRYRDGLFAIVQFKVVGSDGKLGEIINAKGQIPHARREEILELAGGWETTPKYGVQFNVVDAFPVLPTSPGDLEAYIGKYMKGTGIGPAKAKALVAHFGMDLMKIFSENPERLTEVKGVTDAIVEKIKLSWAEEHKNRPAEMWLARHGVSRAYAKRLINHYGAATVTVLQDNPYRATQVDGIGFILADQIAQKLGWPKTSPQRTESAAVFVLQEATNQGHTFLHQGQVIEDLAKVAEASPEAAVAALQRCIEQGSIKEENADSGQGHKLKVYYLPYLQQAEKDLARRVGELVDFHHDIPAQLDDAVNRVQEQMHVPFSAQQLLGIRAAFQNHVSIVTGKPGTGKSTLVKGLIQTCERLGIKYVLAAPTGRAAKRLAEVTERESQTIHRLLEFDPTTYSFRRNETNPIDADMIILDEGSMLELTLAAAAFKAIPDTASLVIIGDIDQLPAVGPGMVLKDLISCGVINVTCLNTIFRQAEGSRIITNAHRISQGLLPQFPEAKGIESDSYLMKVPRTYDSEKDKSVDNIDWVKNTLVKVCRDHIPNKMHVDPIRDIQVLVPMKVGDAGTRALNQVLQKALNPEGLSFDVRGGTFRVGDRVMQFTNDYELGVFNGDIGFIKEWDEDADELVIDFYGKDVRYPASETNSLQLAYAQTIHKSQGGEFKIVIIVMVSQHYVMLERNLIYTANTRAKELCLYIASEWAVKRAVENAQVHARNSFLAARVRGAAQLEVTV